MDANFYIDGFNFYHGIKDTKRKDLLWINLLTLMTSLKQTDCNINKIKYFTAEPVHKPESTQIRHNLWMKILDTFSPEIEVIEGRYHIKYHIEKMTDVNIAVQMLMDAFDDNDNASIYYLISADSDLLPAVKALRNTPTDPFIIVIFPPKRFSKDLRNNADRMKKITIDRLEKNILDNPFVLSSGANLFKPSEWIDKT